MVQSEPLLDHIKSTISDLQSVKHIGSKKYNKPHICVILENVVGIEKCHKELVKVYKSSKDGLYTVRIHKLHHKHISSNTQYVELLSKKHQDRSKKLLNVFLGTADKFNRLCDLQALDVGTKYS